MSHTGNRLRIAAATLLCAYSALALAGDDWLISRVNGLWTWERTGPEGRVYKKYLNQEVLRLAENGTVAVVSLEPIEAGKTVQCSETARHNPQDACSSAFLDCKPAGGGFFAALLAGVINGSRGITDSRNAYRCSVNEEAVLEAAHAVGLIEGILPKTREKPPTPAPAADSNSPYRP